MTISTTASQETVLGNASTFVWTGNFIVGIASNLQVYYNDGTTNNLLSPSQYTLSINAPVTGSLWGVGFTVTYPKTGFPIAVGTSLTFSRIVPLTQLTAISNQGALLLQVIETALDTLCLEIQQVSAKTGQQRGTWITGTIYNYGDVIQDGVNGLNTQNYYMCAIANTSTTWSADLAAGDWSLAINLQNISGYAASAAASATSATASASSATSSAANANTSANNSANSATSSSNSAATATTQAGVATAAANSATTSQTAAAASAAAAATSATTATTQATNATTSANNASSSSTAAATSATNAATSATNAAASAVLAGSTLTATSTTSNTIGTGNFTFTTQANKNFFAGQPLIASSAANGANYIHGFVSSYSGTTLVITETDNGGSGAHTDWNISVSGPQGTSGTGSGTVTSVSVTTSNGVSGSVATATSTPAITISLGAITPTSVAASSTISGTTLTSTVATGTAPLTVSSTTQVPNLNAATAGNATTATALATPRAVYGNNFDGSAALTQVIASTFGGTGNGFSKLSGPTTSEKTFTLPNASAAILTDNAAVTVAQGGTSLGTLTLNNVILGNGTSAPNFVAPSTSGNVLTSNGTTWVSSAAPSSSGSVVYNPQSSGYTLLTSDNGKLVDFTGSSNSTFAFTAAATLGSGWFCYIRNNGTANAEVLLDPNASELIDGLTSYTMYPNECRLVQCTGSAFNTVVLKPFDTGIRTSTYTFTVPPGYNVFQGWLWGSGASGGKGATNGGGGGGGGACLPFDVTTAASGVGVAGSTVTVTIGAGGASQTTANTAGNAGNNSTFGTLFTGYGGGRGGGSSAGAGGGGAGTGFFTAGDSGFTSGTGGNATTTTAGTGGISFETRTAVAADTSGAIYSGGGGGSAAGLPGGAFYGGAGGSAGKAGGGVGGGYTVYGGGGGSGASTTSPSGGGLSIFGGSGGAGATGSNNATAGSAPGGGGGGCITGNSGAGGAGGCRIVGKV